MITAQEALDIANRGMISRIPNLDREIRAQANKGETMLTYNIPDGLSGGVITSLISALKQAGYVVQHQHGSDQRYNESWNYLNISWN